MEAFGTVLSDGVQGVLELGIACDFGEGALENKFQSVKRYLGIAGKWCFDGRFDFDPELLEFGFRIHEPHFGFV
jgi:hypothetical protein